MARYLESARGWYAGENMKGVRLSHLVVLRRSQGLELMPNDDIRGASRVGESLLRLYFSASFAFDAFLLSNFCFLSLPAAYFVELKFNHFRGFEADLAEFAGAQFV